VKRREFVADEHVYLTREGRKLFRVNVQVGETTKHTPVYSVTQISKGPGAYETFEVAATRMRPAHQ
jgi:hypothetical protein